MNNLSIISLILGFIGCACLILSFVLQLYTIYTTKNSKGTSWGLILFQILTCFALGSSASINVYLDGIIHLLPRRSFNFIIYIDGLFKISK